MEVVQGGAKVHVLLAVEGVPAEAQRYGRLPGQRPGDLGHGGVELLGWHHAVDDAQRLQLRRRPSVAEHLHLEQHLARDVPRQDGLDHHRPDADVDLGRAETRAVDRDEKIAGARQAQAAGEGMAVDPADDRLAELRHEDEEVDEQVAAAVALEGAGGAVEARQVGPRAEHAPGPGEHHDPSLGLVPAPAKRRRQVPEHGSRKRVALLRAVERDRGDVTVGGEQDLLQRRLLDHPLSLELGSAGPCDPRLWDHGRQQNPAWRPNIRRYGDTT